MKWFLCMDNMTAYVENTQKSTKKATRTSKRILAR